MMENSDNIRDNLARERNVLASERTRHSAERTISSWIRTGLASVGGGFAIIRLIAFENVSHRLMADIIGEILIIWGILILIFSLLDYRSTCKKHELHVDKFNQLWVTMTVFVFIIVSLFLFFATFNWNLPPAELLKTM